MTEEELLLKIKTELDSSGLDAVEQKAGGIGSKLGALAGPAAAGVAAIGAAGLAAGAALVSVGTTFDDAMDGMRTATGKTGAELDALGASMKTVASGVPNSIAEVSSVMGELSSRTGQTGADLEALTTQVLQMANATGGDAQASVESLTRMLGDASVPTEKQAAALDMVFKASQQTGVGVDRLSQLMVQFGAPMRNLGMTMEESTALLGRFEKEGVNTELVMGALKAASAKWAKEGMAPAEGLKETIAKIQELGPSAEATALAMETFGQKAGGDMVDTILGGKFAIDDLAASIASSNETVASAAKDTEGFSEKWAMFKNKMAIALEPAGTALMDGLTDAFAKLEPYIPAITEGIGKFVGFLVDNPALAAVAGVLTTVAGAFGAIMAVVGPFVPVITGAVGAMGGMSAIAGTVGSALTALVAIITGPVSLTIAALIGLWALWQAKGEEIKEWLAGAGDFIAGKFEEIRAWVAAATDATVTYLSEKWQAIKDYLSAKLTEIGTAISDAWTAIKDTITERIEAARVMISAKWDAIAEYLSAKLEAIGKTVADAWNKVRETISNALAAVEAAMDASWDAVGGIIDTALGFIQDTVSAGMDWIEEKTGVSLGAMKSAWNDIVGGIRDFLAGAIEIMKGNWEDGLSYIREGAYNVWEGIKTIFSNAWNNLKQIMNMDQLLAPFRDGLAKFQQIGGQLIDGLKAGISRSWETLKAWMTGLLGDLVALAKKILGIASPSKVFAEEVGEPIGEGIIQGLRRSLEATPLAGIIGGWGEASIGFIPKLLTPILVAAMTTSMAAAMQKAQSSGLDSAWFGGVGMVGGVRERAYSQHYGPTTGPGSGGAGGVRADAFRSGKGGHLAASKSNYWQVFVSKWGVPTESSARKVAQQLGIPLPQWLEDIYNPKGSASYVDPMAPMKEAMQPASEVARAFDGVTASAQAAADAIDKWAGAIAIDFKALDEALRPITKGGGGLIGPGPGGPIVIEPPPGGAVKVERVELGNIQMGATHVYLDSKEIARGVAKSFIEDVTILDQLGKALGKRKAATT